MVVAKVFLEDDDIKFYDIELYLKTQDQIIIVDKNVIYTNIQAYI